MQNKVKDNRTRFLNLAGISLVFTVLLSASVAAGRINDFFNGYASTRGPHIIDVFLFSVAFFALLWIGFSTAFKGQEGGKGALIALSVSLGVGFALALVYGGKVTFKSMLPFAMIILFVGILIGLYALISKVINPSSGGGKVVAFLVALILTVLLIWLLVSMVCMKNRCESNSFLRKIFGSESIFGKWDSGSSSGVKSTSGQKEVTSAQKTPATKTPTTPKVNLGDNKDEGMSSTSKYGLGIAAILLMAGLGGGFAYSRRKKSNRALARNFASSIQANESFHKSLQTDTDRLHQEVKAEHVGLHDVAEKHPLSSDKDLTTADIIKKVNDFLGAEDLKTARQHIKNEEHIVADILDRCNRHTQEMDLRMGHFRKNLGRLNRSIDTYKKTDATIAALDKTGDIKEGDIDELKREIGVLHSHFDEFMNHCQEQLDIIEQHKKGLKRSDVRDYNDALKRLNAMQYFIKHLHTLFYSKVNLLKQIAHDLNLLHQEYVNLNDAEIEKIKRFLSIADNDVKGRKFADALHFWQLARSNEDILKNAITNSRLDKNIYQAKKTEQLEKIKELQEDIDRIYTQATEGFFGQHAQLLYTLKFDGAVFEENFDQAKKSLSIHFSFPELESLKKYGNALQDIFWKQYEHTKGEKLPDTPALIESAKSNLIEGNKKIAEDAYGETIKILLHNHKSFVGGSKTPPPTTTPPSMQNKTPEDGGNNLPKASETIDNKNTARDAVNSETNSQTVKQALGAAAKIEYDENFDANIANFEKTYGYLGEPVKKATKLLKTHQQYTQDLNRIDQYGILENPDNIDSPVFVKRIYTENKVLQLCVTIQQRKKFLRDKKHYTDFENINIDKSWVESSSLILIGAMMTLIKTYIIEFLAAIDFKEYSDLKIIKQNINSLFPEDTHLYANADILDQQITVYQTVEENRGLEHLPPLAVTQKDASNEAFNALNQKIENNNAAIERIYKATTNPDSIVLADMVVPSAPSDFDDLIRGIWGSATSGSSGSDAIKESKDQHALLSKSLKEALEGFADNHFAKEFREKMEKVGLAYIPMAEAIIKIDGHLLEKMKLIERAEKVDDLKAAGPDDDLIEEYNKEVLKITPVETTIHTYTKPLWEEWTFVRNVSLSEKSHDTLEYLKQLKAPTKRTQGVKDRLLAKLTGKPPEKPSLMKRLFRRK